MAIAPVERAPLTEKGLSSLLAASLAEKASYVALGKGTDPLTAGRTHALDLVAGYARRNLIKLQEATTRTPRSAA